MNKRQFDKVFFMKSKGRKERREVALENLRKAKFFPKKERTEDAWNKRVKQEIETLEKVV